MLEALDGEALYTVAGGLKPVSEGFWRTRIDVGRPDLREVTEIRRALAPWRNDRLWADVHVFHQQHDGRRYAVAWVTHRGALESLLARRADFFAPYGLAPDTAPGEVVAVVERMPPQDRHRGMGLLFGYPEHAIDFFVAADAAKARGETAPARRFVQIPTHESETGRFVYAVPAGVADAPEDRAIAEQAAIRLRRWRQLRASRADPTAADLESWSRTLQDEFDATQRR